VSDGADDFWHIIIWNGFRPRAGELDQPVTFGGSDSTSVQPDSSDSVAVATPSQPAPGDTTTARPPRAPIPRPIPPRLPADTAAGELARARGWTVSFAAFLSEATARQRAASISVDGQTARVVSGQTPGTNTVVYRVVLGPYPTRADAERIGRASGQSFWVYEGNP